MTEVVIDIQDSVFSFVYGMAVGDATNLGPRSIKGERELVGRDRVIRGAVFNYSQSIIHGEKADFDETVKQIQKRMPQLTFGKCQKLINMTVKYLYTKYYDCPVVAKRFDACDAPMDSIMRDFVFDQYNERFNKKPSFSKTVSWSSMPNKQGDYSGFQSAIGELIESRKARINSIQFDFLFYGIAGKRKKVLDNSGIDKKQRQKDIETVNREIDFIWKSISCEADTAS